MNNYKGEMKDGKPHGTGTYTFINGGDYTGGWKNGKKHGKGTITWGDGDTYTGEFKDGEFVDIANGVTTHE